MASCRTCVKSLVFLAFFVCFGIITANRELLISQGKIRGITLKSRNGRNFSAFLGIPYAQPPVGSLRFKNPLPADSWNGTFVADTDGNLCPQYDRHGLPVGHENCLYLNVYSPMTNSSSYLYPTMVYIHGGAFIKGNGGSKYVAPGYIMDKDVVLVAMNYRLGVLGFLSTGDAEATGNFGLKDQVVALKWVQRNIKAFGGDPDRVTLFGQSAGGVSVNLHVLSDASNGLFHRYIAHSGSSLCFWAYHDISTYKKHAIDLGDYVNCPTNNSRALIKCLGEMDAYTLLNTNAIFNGFTTMVNTWVPTNEPNLKGAFLTTSPFNRILRNKIKDYPFIIGGVADEGLIVTAPLYTNDTLYDLISTDTEAFLTQFAASFLPIDDSASLASSVKDFYLNGVDPSDRDTLARNLTNMVSDVAFSLPVIVQLQIALERTKNPFYFYSFEYRGTYSETSMLISSDKNIGVSHTDDLTYFFPAPPERFNRTEIKLSDSDETIVDIMIDLWTSFASGGIPISHRTKDPHIWRPYSFGESYLRIGDNSKPTITRHKHRHEDRMHFWVMRILRMAFKMG